MIFGRHDLGEETACERLLGGEQLGQHQHALGARARRARPPAAPRWRPTGSCPSVRAIGTPKRAPGVAHADRSMPRSRTRRRWRTPSITASVGIGSVSTAASVLHLVLVGDPVLGGLELEELRDVGSRHERLAAGAAEHHDAHAVVVARRAQSSPSCSYIRHVMALRACGRSNMTLAMPPSRTRCTSPSLMPGSVSFIRAPRGLARCAG